MGDVLGALAILDDFLTGVREDLLELADKGGEPSVDLRESVAKVEKWADDLVGGTSFGRNRRMSLVLRLTQEARNSGKTPTAAEVAAWPVLPAEYRSGPVSEKLAAAVAAGTRFDWLEGLLTVFRSIEDFKDGGPEDGDVMEKNLLSARSQRLERRVLGVDPGPVDPE